MPRLVVDKCSGQAHTITNVDHGCLNLVTGEALSISQCRVIHVNQCQFKGTTVTNTGLYNGNNCQHESLFVSNSDTVILNRITTDEDITVSNVGTLETTQCKASDQISATNCNIIEKLSAPKYVVNNVNMQCHTTAKVELTNSIIVGQGGTKFKGTGFVITNSGTVDEVQSYLKRFNDDRIKMRSVNDIEIAGKHVYLNPDPGAM